MHDPNKVVTQIKEVKTNKRSTLKSDALNALIMISINAPKCELLKRHIWRDKPQCHLEKVQNDTKKYLQYK